MLSRDAKKKLLEASCWGYLEDEEPEFTQNAPQNTPKLSYTWGFQPLQNARAANAIRRVAVGRPQRPEVNSKLIRGNGRKPTMGKDMGLRE